MEEKNEGTLQSLMDKSHKPNNYPKQHTEEELKLISDMRKNSIASLVVFWVKLRQRGYARSIIGLYRVLRKTGLNSKKLPNLNVPKPYEKMLSAKESNLMLSLFRHLALSEILMTKNSISILHWINIQDFDISKPLKSTAATVLQFFQPFD